MESVTEEDWRSAPALQETPVTSAICEPANGAQLEEGTDEVPGLLSVHTNACLCCWLCCSAAMSCSPCAVLCCAALCCNTILGSYFCVLTHEGIQLALLLLAWRSAVCHAG